MIYTDLAKVDFKKYKRIIAIGCSFTNYRWETWADLIAMDNPQAEYINMGRSGAGNTYIATQLNHAMLKLDLDENDLVMIMWSTFYREDRYDERQWKNWRTPGNIYTQGDIPMDYVLNYNTERGYTVRDLATIDQTRRIISDAKFDTIQMLGVPYRLQTYYSGIQNGASNLDDVYDMYEHLNSYMAPDLMTTQCPNGWANEYSFIDHDGALQVDYHPSVKSYSEYLYKLGLQLSDSTLDYVNERHRALIAKPMSLQELQETANLPVVYL